MRAYAEFMGIQEPRERRSMAEVIDILDGKFMDLLQRQSKKKQDRGD